MRNFLSTSNFMLVWVVCSLSPCESAAIFKLGRQRLTGRVQWFLLTPLYRKQFQEIFIFKKRSPRSFKLQLNLSKIHLYRVPDWLKILHFGQNNNWEMMDKFLYGGGTVWFCRQWESLSLSEVRVMHVWSQKKLDFFFILTLCLQSAALGCCLKSCHIGKA